MQWISVEDSLPKEEERVLTYKAWENEMSVDYIINCPTPLWACILQRDEYKVTHWMHLPKPPEHQ